MNQYDTNGGGTDLMDSGPRQLQAANQLPPDLMLLKMENDSIMTIARTVPRDPMKIVEQLAALINAYPAAAESAIYSKPVGTVTEVTCGESKCGIKYEVNKVDNDTQCPNCESKKRGKCRPVKKFAEGLSIRAAEAIRSIYGYTRLTTRCEILRDGSAVLTGTLVDYAAGNMTSDERVVPRQYKSKSGQMITIAEDRFLGVVVKAEKAKLMRDVILGNTPGIIKAMFRDMCEQKMLDLVSPELIEQKIIPAFADYGITREHLDKIVGRPLNLGWKEQERLSLRKILSALKNDETTAAEILDGLQDKPELTVLSTAKPVPQTTTELAEQLKAKQQQAAADAGGGATSSDQATKPESSKTESSTPPTSVAVDEAKLLADAAIDFNACENIPMITKCAAEWNAKQPTPSFRLKIAELTDNARERLRESRQKPNK
ncbi:hypothetical protein NA78x_001777 [Anatilimnocola sp. NA78]|uniref:hypothetical protein n=1 Tax=Anatilimnocola sp. NA78 TaxID=3415683 RepID=UPI003CE48F1A